MSELTGRPVPPFLVEPLGADGSFSKSGRKVSLPDAFRGTPFVLHFYNNG